MTLLSGGDNVIKYLLFIFNFLFVITGIILLSIGLAVQGAFFSYEHLLEDRFFAIPAFLIAIGIIIFIIAFFGCYGAIRENYCMVLTFSILLVLVFILELAAGISGYVLRNETEALLERSLRDSMQDFVNNNPAATGTTGLWDAIQQKYECCGVHNSTDWTQVANNTEKKLLPMSCCEIPQGQMGPFECTDARLGDRAQGCLSGFSSYIMAHAVSLGAAGIAICIIQFIGIFFACYLARQIKNKQGGHSGF
ncbi:CD63 antigen [Phlebotomus argentipes]|uniref:CD63 antigen n=1 Tax=Phlebotomus argentipes TaxID=94469 RepID=UPI002892E1E8|nr:CD63 antigen [Phlebotomus argentipes]